MFIASRLACRAMHACNRTREQGAGLRHTGLSLNRTGGRPLMHSSRLQRVSAHSLQASTVKKEQQQQQLQIFRFDLRALKPCLKHAASGNSRQNYYYFFLIPHRPGHPRRTRVYYLRPTSFWKWAEGNNQLLKQDLGGRETASLTANFGVERQAGINYSRLKGTVSTPNFEDGGTFDTFRMFTPIKWPKAACGGSQEFTLLESADHARSAM